MCPVEARLSHVRRFAAILLLVVCAASATAQSALKVSKIEIRPIGPATVSEELIRSNLRMKEGDPYIRLSVDDDDDLSADYRVLYTGNHPTPASRPILMVECQLPCDAVRYWSW